MTKKIKLLQNAILQDGMFYRIGTVLIFDNKIEAFCNQEKINIMVYVD